MAGEWPESCHCCTVSLNISIICLKFATKLESLLLGQSRLVNKSNLYSVSVAHLIGESSCHRWYICIRKTTLWIEANIFLRFSVPSSLKACPTKTDKHMAHRDTLQLLPRTKQREESQLLGFPQYKTAPGRVALFLKDGLCVQSKPQMLWSWVFVRWH